MIVLALHWYVQNRGAAGTFDSTIGYFATKEAFLLLICIKEPIAANLLPVRLLTLEERGKWR